MRWDANNFTQLLCSSYDYKRNRLKEGIADFQYIADGDYTVVSFHIYVPYGYETPYFKIETTDAQLSKVIDFECDTLAIYKGYADLTSANDINSNNPQMPDIEIETKNASFLEDVTFVRGNKNSSSEDGVNKTETEIDYIIPAVVGIIVGPIILAAGIVVFIVLLLKRR